MGELVCKFLGHKIPKMQQQMMKEKKLIGSVPVRCARCHKGLMVLYLYNHFYIDELDEI